MLAVVAVSSELNQAVNQALQATDVIYYDDKFFRRDIAKKALDR